ncbi:MAG: GGDEF domain-containing protein [Candidatus Cloacimonetes bacterium]|nr:GGDEF domain-containing protein [Candidatus Cloacimonadota bacterium]
MKKIFFIILLFTFFKIIYADISLEKLEQSIKISSDSEKIDIYNYLCTENWNKSISQSIIYATNALNISNKIGDESKELESLGNLATSFGIISDYANAEKYYLILLEKSKKLDEKEIKIRTLTDLGFISDQTQKYKKAIKYYKELAGIYKKANNQEKLAKIYGKIASIYKKDGNYEKSLLFYINSLKSDEKNLNDIIKNDYLKLASKHDNLGEKEKADEYYRIFNIINDSIQNTKILQQINQLKEDFEIEFSENIIREKAKIEDQLKTLSQKERDLQNVLSKVKQESVQKDKYLESIKKDRAIKELELNNKNLEIKNYELEIERKNFFIETQKQQRYFFILMIAIAFTFGIIHTYLYYIKKIDNKLLGKANEKIKLKNMQLEKLNIILKEIARTDPLTDLPNRRAILEKIDYEKTRFERTHSSYVLSICDIDNFKKINDTYGHDFGDFVLKKLAKIMKSTLRKQDTVGRWGGEEFLIMLPETNLKGGKIAIEKLRKDIEKEGFEYQKKNIKVTMTFGIKLNDKTISTQEVVGLADKALYHGKKTGKNKVVIFEKMQKLNI